MLERRTASECQCVSLNGSRPIAVWGPGVYTLDRNGRPIEGPHASASAIRFIVAVPATRKPASLINDKRNLRTYE